MGLKQAQIKTCSKGFEQKVATLLKILLLTYFFLLTFYMKRPKESSECEFILTFFWQDSIISVQPTVSCFGFVVAIVMCLGV